MEGMVRTVKSALGHRIGAKVRPADAEIPWLVEHASQLYSRYRVGRDGRTPVERKRGRAVRRPVCEFGEQVMYNRFLKFHSVFLGRDFGTLKSDIVSKNIHN